LRLWLESILVLQPILHFQQLAILGLYLGFFLVQGDGCSTTYPGNSNLDIFDLLVLGVSGCQEHRMAKMSQIRILWCITILDQATATYAHHTHQHIHFQA
jgi:hypothetical protein